MALTDTSGSAAERYIFDAFGLRRNTNWTAGSQSGVSHIQGRGYTGHEHLDNIELTHMNGRVQDPLLGRMISADPTVPFPLLGESWNRHSYVLNSPLSLVDPTGYSPDDPKSLHAGAGDSILSLPPDSLCGGACPMRLPTNDARRDTAHDDTATSVNSASDAEQLLIDLTIEIAGQRIGSNLCEIDRRCTDEHKEVRIHRHIERQSNEDCDQEPDPRGCTIVHILQASGAMADPVIQIIEKETRDCQLSCANAGENPLIPQSIENVRRALDANGDVSLDGEIDFENLNNAIEEILNEQINED